MADDITPDLEDVGAVLRARTRSDAAGTEIGTFDATTRPTGAEVTDYITLAVAEVRLWLPTAVPDEVEPFVKRLAAIRAAMQVEVSYDPDRTGDGSAYARLKEMYDEGKAELLEALSARGEGLLPRIGSLSTVSPTLAPYSDEVREAIAPDPWPWP